MNGSEDMRNMRSRRRRRSVRALAALTVLLGVSLAAVALASGGGPTVMSASNSELHQRIVVDAQGRTLYVLSPETTHHLLCKSRECFAFWPPLTVRSSKTSLRAGSGVHGKLAILRRSNGTLQVTLGGLPLYRYAGDRAKGEANGQHVRTFGGTWHVLSAAGSSSSAPTTPPTPTTPTTPTAPGSPTTPNMPTTPTTPTTPSQTPGYGY